MKLGETRFMLLGAFRFYDFSIAKKFKLVKNFKPRHYRLSFNEEGYKNKSNLLLSYFHYDFPSYSFLAIHFQWHSRKVKITQPPHISLNSKFSNHNFCNELSLELVKCELCALKLVWEFNKFNRYLSVVSLHYINFEERINLVHTTKLHIELIISNILTQLLLLSFVIVLNDLPR